MLEKDIKNLTLRTIELGAETIIYKISHSQISKGNAFFEFCNIEKVIESYLWQCKYEDKAFVEESCQSDGYFNSD